MVTQIYGSNCPGFISCFKWIDISLFQCISQIGKMFSWSGEIRCNDVEVLINSIGDSFSHCFVVGSISDIHVITFITHKSHFQDRNRYSAPVGTGHIVCRDHTFVGKSGGRTVAVYDTFGQSITFFDKVCIKILVGAGRCHSKCSGSGCAVVAVCMNADGDICILRGGKFRTFFVADRFIVVFSCHDDFISAGSQFLFKNERHL